MKVDLLITKRVQVAGHRNIAAGLRVYCLSIQTRELPVYAGQKESQTGLPVRLHLGYVVTVAWSCRVYS